MLLIIPQFYLLEFNTKSRKVELHILKNQGIHTQGIYKEKQ